MTTIERVQEALQQALDAEPYVTALSLSPAAHEAIQKRSQRPNSYLDIGWFLTIPYDLDGTLEPGTARVWMSDDTTRIIP